MWECQPHVDMLAFIGCFEGSKTPGYLETESIATGCWNSAHLPLADTSRPPVISLDSCVGHTYWWFTFFAWALVRLVVTMWNLYQAHAIQSFCDFFTMLFYNYCHFFRRQNSVAGSMILQIVAGVLASYATCSLVLLFFPSIIHKKKQPVFVCQHISHRGGKSAQQPGGWLWHQSEAVCQGFQLIQFRADPHSGTLGLPNLSAFRNVRVSMFMSCDRKHLDRLWKPNVCWLFYVRVFFSKADPGLFKWAHNFFASTF